MWRIEVLCAVAFIVVFFSHWIYRWRNPKCNGVLPPGSSGFPLIGETLDLILNPIYTFGVHPFVTKRLQRYGPLFRTNVAGQNVVISSDPEFNSFIVHQEGKLVVQSYLGLFAKLFKQEGNFRPDAHTIHKYGKNLMLRHFGVECIRQSLLPQFDELVRRTLKSWSAQEKSTEVISAGVAMFGEFGAKQLFSFDPERARELSKLFVSVSTSLTAFPLNIPGTTYHKSLKDKEKAVNMLRDVVNARIGSQGNTQDDLLNKMINDSSSMNFITEEFITQLLFSLQFAAAESVPMTLAILLHFIADNPKVLEDLIAEHEKILKNRENSESPITWEEYKSMTFTLKVINETLRLTNILPGLLRRVLKDISVKGYTIPAGWGVMAYNSIRHFDPQVYSDPMKFDPYRWEDVKSESICKNFMPFGGGIKQCSGSEFARTSISLFLHYLVTKYRWSIVKRGQIVQNPIMQYKNGLHISLVERSN